MEQEHCVTILTVKSCNSILEFMKNTTSASFGFFISAQGDSPNICKVEGILFEKLAGVKLMLSH